MIRGQTCIHEVGALGTSVTGLFGEERDTI